MSSHEGHLHRAVLALTRRRASTPGAMGGDKLLQEQLDAINSTQAVAHYDPDGYVIDANPIFLDLTGYGLEEISGRQHSLFMPDDQSGTGDNQQFWARLRSGETRQGALLHRHRSGSDLWLRTSYNPIRNRHGAVIRIVQYAVDITPQTTRNLDFEGQVKAIRSTQAVIQFTPDGIILEANDLFLAAMGYELGEIVGKHHHMFVDPIYAESADYANFWRDLAEGRSRTSEFMRIGKDGREVWIQASYIPILDRHGRTIKVVKYATDVTAARMQNADYRGQIEGINDSQAVIHFTVDGTITDANRNFLQTVSYSLDEIRGKHHRLFVEPQQQGTSEYLNFWTSLASGKAHSGDFLRIGKNGRRVWIHATYTPIRDLKGRVCRVVKYATDITGQKNTAAEIARLIDAVRDGDLSSRADLDNSSGDNRILRENINQMLDVIAVPVHEMSQVMNEVAHQNLTVEVRGHYQGEFKELKDNINTALGKLHASLKQARTTASIVKSGTQEIAAGNSELSVRTEEQASSLEETAAAMEEMTATVQQTANNAKLANQLALSARSSADTGRSVVQQAVDAMTEITNSSHRINSIVEVIDSIAFQTNLLALNAAVEAARAGDQGRGFAVVADEVRKLASRSAGAAREIKDLIADSSRKVGEGSLLVNRSGQMLEEISSSVKKVSNVVEEIMAAASEQADGIASVNAAVQQMDEMTQQNAALVEEAAANSEALTSQSEVLGSMMEAFRV